MAYMTHWESKQCSPNYCYRMTRVLSFVNQDRKSRATASFQKKGMGYVAMCALTGHVYTHLMTIHIFVLFVCLFCSLSSLNFYLRDMKMILPNTALRRVN